MRRPSFTPQAGKETKMYSEPAQRYIESVEGDAHNSAVVIIEELVQRLATLRAVVDRLPKTADGVPVTIGDLVIWGIPPMEAECQIAWDCIPRTGGVWGYVVQDANGTTVASPQQCYSTRALAEAAKEKP